MKYFFRSLAGLIIIIILGIVIVLFIGWGTIPEIISNNLSKKMKVSVEIGDLGFSLTAIKIDGFEIGNPSPAILAKAMSAEKIRIDGPITNFFKQDVVIDDILIDNVYLGFEFDNISSPDGNWTTIMKNYQQATIPPAGMKKEEQRSVLIKSLILTNISVELVYRKGDQKVQKLPSIPRLEFTNITSEGGIPTDQIMNSVLGQMLKSVFEKENIKNMLQNLLQNPPSGVDKYITPFKGLFSSCDDEECVKESA